MPKPKLCKDCKREGVTARRPTPHPGPRCATHHRMRLKQRRAHAHARMLEVVYGLTRDQYWALYSAQGGVCAICHKATGKTKRLAVDHDHTTGQVRGLLCGPCNQTIGRLNQQALARAIKYLKKPPAGTALTPKGNPPK